MGRPVFFVESLLSRRTFPDHALTASTTETGLDVAFVATGRRQRSLNRWAPDSYNAAAYIECAFDQARSFDHLALDRGHNLDGHTVEVWVSSDDFATHEVAATDTIPSTVTSDSDLDDFAPVRTEEGAILWRMAEKQTGTSARIVFPAMGAGLKPEVVGAYLGMAFIPEHAPQKPFSHGKVRILYDVERSPQAWAAAGEIGKLRVGTVELWLSTRAEYTLARYHIEGLYFSRKPMWLAMNDEEAERAILVVCPPGDAGFEISSGWSEYRGTIPFEELEPALW